ncbi:MAG: permease-like cell division protein FtsX [Clostridia bacterium]|nr:permease-like cell division protein FtsX [Clostridia bacterium]
MRYNLISYLIGDGVKNISKNKKSTFSAITIMLVTMLTVGICFIIGENVNAILGKMEEEYPLEVYLKDDITVSEKEKLESEIRNIEYVNPSITYITKEEAYHKALEKVGNDTVMIAGYNENNHPFPPSFIITFTNLEKVDEVAAKVEQLNNVIGTTREDQKDNTESLTKLDRNVNIALVAIGGALIVFSIIIIGNTIKLTVHARRKEISIMKYVGATNNFIRAPFVVEGIIIGLISSFISLLILAGLYVWIKGNVIGNGLESWLEKLGVSSGIQLLDFSQMFTQISIIFLALGIGIGVFGSLLSMKKYLKV